jgi:hypothetical protein
MRFHTTRSGAAREAIRALLALLLAGSAAACAPRQRIPLGCIPKDVTVYVDGEALEPTPSELVLRSDRPHTVFVKGEGYEPEMIVLESAERDGEHRLTPADVCLQPRFVGVRRELEVEVEEEPKQDTP